ncbi:MAG: hypothetical protein KIG84_01295 [Bacteroidales bacterium]|nr:hypothetical protein [Bacteroidales bacterium]
MKEREYMVTVDVESIVLYVTANSKEEAEQKAIKEVKADPNYLMELKYWAVDNETELVD